MGTTRAHRETALIPTYPLPDPDRHPVFFEKRVYQGSSGKVYPLAFYSRVSDSMIDQPWDRWTLENDYVRVELLPELGGRIWRGLDKTNDYDFFYHQPVVKPALVGLAGPWLSGGVEFNWPQHHRPATYLPADAALEEHEDGSKTVWLSDHDPMVHMKGMHGVTIRPGSSVVELNVRLYNRTPFKHTFLWWANVAALVHDDYQSFFPPDVRYVADHAVRAMSSFPIARNHYYGVDYRPGTDLAWYKNIPVPTSYMITRTDYDFFGGFDHKAGGGFVHVANRHVSPGKKQWTWGNHEFGWAWDRELTEPDANGWYPPYVELMAGVYTDNQPDFSYLMPYETKTFTQVWWPIQSIGAIHNANRQYAVNLLIDSGKARVGLCASSDQPDTRLVVTAGGSVVHDEPAPVSPGRPARIEVDLPAGCPDHRVTVKVVRAGVERLRFTPPDRGEDVTIPASATEPPAPAEIASADEMYLTGEHLEQYRHPTRDPDRYWRQALEADPGDVRCNTALGRRLLTRGLLEDAAHHLRAAVDRARIRHPNPEDGEPVYFLGLALKLLGKADEAYQWLYKSTWNYAWRAAGYYQVATLDARRGDYELAIEHLDAAQQTNAQHSNARNLQAALLRRTGRLDQALALIDAALAQDRLDHWAAFERAAALRDAGDPEADAAAQHWKQASGCRAPTLLDLAFDYADAGLFDEALAVLNEAPTNAPAMIAYTRGWVCALAGRDQDAQVALDAARRADGRWMFPDRIEEEAVLRHAIERSGVDARAANALGNLLYDKRRYTEAIAAWEQARAADDSFAEAHRNLGLAYFNARQQTDAARVAYDRAFELDPTDGQVLFEYDQLLKRAGEPPADRLARFEGHLDLVAGRDDLSIEYVTLLNLTGRHADAAAALAGRRFHPWEGGEGKAMAQHVAAHLALCRAALARSDAKSAVDESQQALDSPHNLGESKHLLANLAEIQYHLALALRASGDRTEAEAQLAKAAASGGDFLEMAVQDYSCNSYFKGLSKRLLGDEVKAKATFEGMRTFGQCLQRTEAKIDYFATSLPDLLVFNDDLQKRREIEGTLLEALAAIGLGDADAAASRFNHVVERDPSNSVALSFLQERQTHGAHSVLWSASHLYRGSR